MIYTILAFHKLVVGMHRFKDCTASSKWYEGWVLSLIQYLDLISKGSNSLRVPHLMCFSQYCSWVSWSALILTIWAGMSSWMYFSWSDAFSSKSWRKRFQLPLQIDKRTNAKESMNTFIAESNSVDFLRSYPHNTFAWVSWSLQLSRARLRLVSPTPYSIPLERIWPSMGKSWVDRILVTGSVLGSATGFAMTIDTFRFAATSPDIVLTGDEAFISDKPTIVNQRRRNYIRST